MLKRTTQTLGFIMVACWVASISPAAAAQANVLRHGQRLSLNFRDTTLKGVLQELDRDANISVKIPPALRRQALLDRKVTISLHNVEIGLALQSLFNSISMRNFAIVYQPGAQGRVTVVLAEEGKGGAAPSSRESADESPALSPPAAAPAPEADAPATTDTMAGARWPSANSDPNAPTPATIPQLPQFADEEASGPSGPQEMPEPVSGVPPAMRNLPPEPGPAYPGGPEGSPFTPQMRANMGFPPPPKQ